MVLLNDYYNPNQKQLLSNFDYNNIFYFDETNNHRKIWLKENNFNINTDLNFILGGIVLDKDKNLNLDELKKLLKIQPNIKELKSKHIDSSKDIKEFLNNNKVMLFLNYLKENNIFIHYFNVNNLYFSIVDIVDSLDYIENFDIANTAKNTLYRLFVHYPEEFFKILKSYNYPNIENIKEFLIDLLDLLEIYNDEYLKKYSSINNTIITNPISEHTSYEILYQLLKYN